MKTKSQAILNGGQTMQKFIDRLETHGRRGHVMDVGINILPVWGMMKSLKFVNVEAR